MSPSSPVVATILVRLEVAGKLAAETFDRGDRDEVAVGFEGFAALKRIAAGSKDAHVRVRCMPALAASPHRYGIVVAARNGNCHLRQLEQHSLFWIVRRREDM